MSFNPENPPSVPSETSNEISPEQTEQSHITYPDLSDPVVLAEFQRRLARMKEQIKEIESARKIPPEIWTTVIDF